MDLERDRQLWNESPERTKVRRYSAVAVVTLVAILALGLLNSLVRLDDANEQIRRATDAAEDAQRAAGVSATSLAAAESAVSLARTDLDAAAGAFDPVAEEIDAAKTALSSSEASEASARDAFGEASAAADEAEADLDSWSAERRSAVRSMWGVATFVLLLAFIFWTIRWVAVGELRRAVLSRAADAALGEEVDALVEESTEAGLDLPGLVRANSAQLKRYHQLVTDHAERSRQFTLAAIGVSFSYLMLVLIAAALATSDSAAIATGLVGTAGAAMGAFLGQTVLRNAESSSSELLALASHPIAVERLLNAERLIRGLPEDRQAEAVLIVLEALTTGEGVPLP